jgi:ABC-type dipeptide/oligopeptide/nickel transport system permease subunit
MAELVNQQVMTEQPPMVAPKGRSLWADAFRRLRKDKLAMVCLTVIIFYLVLAALCSTGVIFSSYNVTNNADAYQAPSSQHWMGTDIFGRDVLARAAHGTVISLIVGFFGSALAMMIGTVLGAIAGYFGKWVDELIVWLYTTIDTIPYILLVVAFSFISGPGLRTLCTAIGLTSWIGHCRIIRSEFMKHREREYVQGAKALGAGNFRRIFLHILPNTFHLVLINFSLLFVSAVKTEVILTYLGLGVKAGTPSWGMMISDAKLELSREVWWGLAAATGFMFFLVLAFTLFNDALRDALDPKLKNR